MTINFLNSPFSYTFAQDYQLKSQLGLKSIVENKIFTTCIRNFRGRMHSEEKRVLVLGFDYHKKETLQKQCIWGGHYVGMPIDELDRWCWSRRYRTAQNPVSTTVCVSVYLMFQMSMCVNAVGSRKQGANSHQFCFTDTQDTLFIHPSV